MPECIQCRSTQSRGWAVRASDKAYICYECCHKNDLAQIARREPISCYLSGDSTYLANWPGDRLMRVLHVVRRQSYGIHSYSRIYLHYVRARDDAGHEWYGKGAGPYMHITMRPCKGRKKG